MKRSLDAVGRPIDAAMRAATLFDEVERQPFGAFTLEAGYVCADHRHRRQPLRVRHAGDERDEEARDKGHGSPRAL